MHRTLRVVIDTNVLVSPLIGHGKPRQLVFQLLTQHEIVSSRQMLAELADVLSRKKFTEIDKSANSYQSLGAELYLSKLRK